MGSLSMLVPRHERPLVRATAALLFARASQAGDSSPLCRRTCYVIAAIAPELPLARLSILVRYGVWSVKLDDRIDGAGVDPGALGELRISVAGALAGRSRAGSGAGDALMTELSGIVEGLTGYDRSGECLAWFGGALQDAVATGIAHATLGQAVAAGEARPPTAEEYLAVAGRTANYDSFGYALLAVGAGSHSIIELSRVAPALGHGGAALRLGNDLRSVARDRAESTLNVLGLRTAAGSPVTPGYVRGEIERRMWAHDRVLGTLGQERGGPARTLARTLVRSLRTSVRLYRLADLRPQPQPEPQPEPEPGPGTPPRSTSDSCQLIDYA
jgi:hypothetical protein